MPYRPAHRSTTLCFTPESLLCWEPTLLTAATYLDELNLEQRRAVEDRVRQDSAVGPPLLVIAWAGSGKTNTLAHRVAHLIVNGAVRNVSSQEPRIDIGARIRERWR
jgi:hypothetical protein